MTSVWQRHRLRDRVVEILGEAVPGAGQGHLGYPFLTAYQVAIELDARYPELARELGVRIGGRDTGSHFTLSSYLGAQLVRVVREEPGGDIEGACLGRGRLVDLRFKDAQGGDVASSLIGTFNPVMFRLRG